MVKCAIILVGFIIGITFGRSVPPKTTIWNSWGGGEVNDETDDKEVENKLLPDKKNNFKRRFLEVPKFVTF